MSTRFVCSKPTLLSIPYFAVFLQSVFNESTEETNRFLETVHIDRDAGLFAILYEFARTPVLFVPDVEKLPRLLIEAEYYSLTTFIEAVKIRCIKNVYSYLNWASLTPEQHAQAVDVLITKTFDDVFPGIVDFATSQYVPFSYSNKGFFKVLSSSPSYTGVQLVHINTHEGNHPRKYANGHFYYHGPIVGIQPGSSKPKPIPSSQRIRYVRLSDGKIFDEPLVHFSTGLLLIDWTCFDIFAQEGSCRLTDLTQGGGGYTDVDDYFKDFGKFYLEGPPPPSPAEPGDPSSPPTPTTWTPAPDVVLDYYEGETENDQEPSFTHLQLRLQNPITLPVSYLCRYLELIELEGYWQRGPNVGRFIWEDDSL